MRKVDFTPEVRRKIAESSRQRWQDPAYRKNMIEHSSRVTPARKKHLEKLHSDPAVVAKRVATLRRTIGEKTRGFDVPVEMLADYRLFKRKLGSAFEAGRVLGLVKVNE